MDWDWMMFLQIVAAGMILTFVWRGFKHWKNESPKAQPGDWGAAILPLGLVVLFVLFLISSV